MLFFTILELCFVTMPSNTEVPVRYYSRTLSSYERNYVQIGKEAPALFQESKRSTALSMAILLKFIMTSNIFWGSFLIQSLYP